MVGAQAELTPLSYVAGLLALSGVVAVLSFGAWRFRVALLPDWSGAPARLAEVIVALAALIFTGRLLGEVGALHPGWVLLTAVAAGIALAGIARLIRARRERAAPAPSVPPVPSSPREEVLAAALAVAAVVMQWGVYTADALSRGMTHPDTLWYHGPFTVRFLQQGHFGRLEGLGNESLRHYPLDSELLHALAAMPFDRDFLSPLLNLGWLAIALLAAWCVGRRAGVGALGVLGAAVVCGVPVLTGSQPGQASNDIAPAALLLAATALLVEGGIGSAGVALAGVAAGLGLGTKLIVAVPAAVLTAGVVVLARRARRPAAAGWWCAGLVAAGGHWLVRNWLDVGNPLPWYGLRLGPFSLTRLYDESGTSLVDFADPSGAWRDLYYPSLSPALGRAWPLLLGLPLAAALFVLLRRRGDGFVRLLGATAVAGFAMHPFTPYTAGAGFAANLRYLAPSLLVGAAIGALALAAARRPWRLAATTILLGIALLQAIEVRTSEVSPWPSNYLLPGLLAGLAAGAVVAARRPALGRRRLLAGVAVLTVGAGGWWLQRHYLERRYVDAGLHLDATNTYFRDVHDARVAVIGSETYPLFGLDLSNRVEQVEARAASGPGTDGCRGWRLELGDRYDYLVLTRQEGFLGPPPPEDWFAGDPAATTVSREPDGVVFGLDGPLDPDGCT